MDIYFQIWGALFYLTNKILFVISQHKRALLEKKLKMAAWVIYILGVPAWVIILIGHQNWIAASIEIGGVPAMILGLYNTYHDNRKANKAFTWLVAFCTYLALAFGCVMSFMQHGGLVSITQMLEIGVMIGFLLGSYNMAKNNPAGWLFFMLMNISMATLMFVQHKPILMAQQLLSLCFVLYGYKQTIHNK